MKKYRLKRAVCTKCSMLDHFTYQHDRVNHPRKKPKAPRDPAVVKAEELAVIKAKQRWYKANPPNEQGLWFCHYCDAPLAISLKLIAKGVQRITIDHKIPKNSIAGRARIADPNNFLPCCETDNKLKGSLSYNNFCRKYYPHLLNQKLLV